MTTCVVTGAAGFLGSHLSEALLADGLTVIGIDNFDPFYDRETKERNLTLASGHPSFRFEERDITHPDALTDLLTSDSVVVHLAAKPGVRPSIANPLGYAHANVIGTMNVAASMQRAGATRLVFASSSSVYGNSTPSPFREDAEARHPISPYAASKRAAELLLESLAEYGDLRVAALRYFSVFGPRQRPDLALPIFTRRMLAGAPVTLYGDGTQARDYTYVSDIVAGTIAAIRWTATAQAGVRYFNLGGNQAVTVSELLKTLSEALGVEPTVEWTPLPEGDVERTAADLTESGRVLGYTPSVSLAEGVAHFVRWYREAHGSQH